MRNTNFIAFDTETTGLRPLPNLCNPNAVPDEILQLSIVGEISGEKILFDEYFRPSERRIEYGWQSAERIHGISPESTLDKLPLSHYSTRVQELFDQADVLIAYNGNFDISFLEAAGIYVDRTKVYDVMRAFTELLRENNVYGSHRNRKLTECAAYFGYNWDQSKNAHNALGDAMATLYCYEKLKACC